MPDVHYNDSRFTKEDGETEGGRMDLHFKQSGHLGILIISGEVIPGEEASLKKTLMGALDSVEHLLIYFERTGSVSGPLLHTLCAAYKYCSRLHKRLTLIGNQADVLKKDILTSKIVNIPSCISDCSDKCLWA